MTVMMTSEKLDLVPHQHRCGCGREFRCTTSACVDKIIPCTVCRIDGARGVPRRKMPMPVPKVNLPGMAIAGKLPSTYEAARLALSECSRIDECKGWADKAQALASYAKQAADEGLRKMADRIQARAIRRCGELLHQIEPAPGVRTDLHQPEAGADPRLTRTAAARDAGLSVRQQKTAVRVARIPEPDFNAAVESDDPPTVTELAERGRTVRTVVDPVEKPAGTVGLVHVHRHGRGRLKPLEVIGNIMLMVENAVGILTEYIDSPIPDAETRRALTARLDAAMKTLRRFRRRLAEGAEA